MLTALRRQAGSWVAKVLLILLAASFGLWGVGDIFGGFNDPVLAEVGDLDIRASEFLPEYGRRLAEVRRARGGSFSEADAVRAGLHRQTLDSMVSRLLLDAEGEEAGLIAGEKDLAAWIRSMEMFQGADGGFDRVRFTLAAREQGLDEKDYLETLGDLRRSQYLIGTMLEGAVVADRVVRVLHKVRNERREARAAVFLASEGPEPEPAGDADVQARYDEDGGSAYRVPEFRDFSAAVLDPEELKAGIEIGEDELAEEFERRRSGYVEPERRRVVQFLAADAAEAEAVMALAREGRSLADAAAEAAGADPADLDLGLVLRGDLDPDLAEAAFAAATGTVAGPEETPFGHRLLEITEVQAGREPALDEIRDALRDEVALERAYDLLHDRAELFYDELAAGASLEDAARTAGTEVFAVAGVDASGRDEAGGVHPGTDDLDLVGLAFATGEGQTTDLEDLPAGRLAAVRVEGITPSRAKTLDEAREEVLAALAADARLDGARERAEAFAAEAADSDDLAALAESHSGSVRASGSFTRDGEGADGAFPREAVAETFRMDGGATGTPVAPSAPIELGAGGYAVVVLDAVTPAEDPADGGEDDLGESLRAALGEDILVSFVRSLRDAHPVETDAAALNRVITGGTATF